MTDAKPKFEVVSIKPPVNEEVVATVEQLLALAKAGKVTSLAYAITGADGGLSWCITKAEDRPRQLAAASRLLHQLHVLMDKTVSEMDTPE